MRHNLTNIAETQLDKVDSFYVVGSTTKEGLIEGRSNVKIDLKKAIAEGGGGDSETFDAKKFGDDIMKYIYTNLSDSTVFPDMYYVTDASDTPSFLGPPESDVEFAAIISGAILNKVIVPVYSSIPSSDKVIISIMNGFALKPEGVEIAQVEQVEIDGAVYYIFTYEQKPIG